MSALAFFDTNVLVYADDAASAPKQKRAIELFSEHLRQGTAVLSLQVLQEYFVAATRKFGVPADVAQRKVEIFSNAKVVRFDPPDVIAAIELHRLTQISFWDALIVHAARISGSSILFSEDFSGGAMLAGVRIVNPFSS
ncbi:MAG: PIN domain-containing protein [Acidobacteriaceae bacterium]|nr:PIN domain-containing protein [Acidobacteriaceae bacterium]